jgi:hypothetical protein
VGFALAGGFGVGDTTWAGGFGVGDTTLAGGVAVVGSALTGGVAVVGSALTGGVGVGGLPLTGGFGARWSRVSRWPIPARVAACAVTPPVAVRTVTLVHSKKSRMSIPRGRPMARAF